MGAGVADRDGGIYFRAATVCPNCNARVGVPEHIAEFNCPACGTRLEVGAGGDVRRL